MAATTPRPRQGTVWAQGLEFAYLELGEGPLALCLHGFPDTARTWRHLLPELASAGFRAVAPWLRGYAPTGVPGDGRYQVGALAADANALHEVLGGDSAAICIGHDWGALAAHGACVLAPERWRRVVLLATPPLAALDHAFASYEQTRRLWYAFLFQTELAERIVGRDLEGFLWNLWRDWSPGLDPTTELPSVLEALGAPDNLRAALSYYRALLNRTPLAEGLAAEQAACRAPAARPTLFLHGSDDGCIGAEVARQADGLFPPGSERGLIGGVGHFPHLEDPKSVGRAIVQFLTNPPACP
jgi:pimeloyl-ACP methyl ester carboxylesterase